LHPVVIPKELVTQLPEVTAATLNHLHQLKLMEHSKLATAVLAETVETLVLAVTVVLVQLEALVETQVLVDQVEMVLLVVLAELFEPDELTLGVM